MNNTVTEIFIAPKKKKVASPVAHRHQIGNILSLKLKTEQYSGEAYVNSSINIVLLKQQISSNALPVILSCQW